MSEESEVRIWLDGEEVSDVLSYTFEGWADWIPWWSYRKLEELPGSDGYMGLMPGLSGATITFDVEARAEGFATREVCAELETNGRRYRLSGRARWYGTHGGSMRIRIDGEKVERVAAAE